MAQGAKNPYGKYGVYGSPAYDFRPVGNERAGDYGKAEGTERKTPFKHRRQKSPAVPVAAILCTLLLFAGILSQSSLVEISDETYALRQEIDELLEQQRELKIQHALAFPFSDTEEYAIEVLGMQKAGAGQICPVEVPDVQHATETINEEKADILSLLREYFPG